MGRNGAGKGYFMADKKPRKCLSAPQVFIRTASRLSAQPAFICANRIRAASLFHARRIYLRRTLFIRTVSLFSAHRVCLRRKRLPLAVFPANETPQAHAWGVSL